MHWNLISKEQAASSVPLPTIDNSEPCHIDVLLRAIPEKGLPNDESTFKASSSDNTVLFRTSNGPLQNTTGDTHSTFQFDKVFDANATQKDVQDFLLDPTINDVLSGYNSTILTYGPSFSGKSYSLIGPQDGGGILPNICKALFSTLEDREKIRETISASVFWHSKYIWKKPMIYWFHYRKENH